MKFWMFQMRKSRFCGNLFSVLFYEWHRNIIDSFQFFFFFFFFFLKSFPGKGLYFSMRVPHVGGIGFDPMSPPPTRSFSWGQPLTIFADHWTTNDLKVTRHNKSMTIIHFFLSEIIFCEKKLKLYGPFLWMVFNCLKASATPRRQFTFYP